MRGSFRLVPGTAISIETTPRIAAAEPNKIEAYARAGIERISMGVQVIQPDLLRVLNRSGNGVEPIGKPWTTSAARDSASLTST